MNHGALPYSDNWACKAVGNAIADPSATKEEVAEAIVRQPEFLGAIQEVLDERVNWIPDQPGGDPAAAVVSSIIRKLSEAVV